MYEGSEAFNRFQAAVRAALTVPKSLMPPSPFKKQGKIKRKLPSKIR
jgi:hypothetical protein